MVMEVMRDYCKGNKAMICQQSRKLKMGCKDNTGYTHFILNSLIPNLLLDDLPHSAKCHKVLKISMIIIVKQEKVPAE